MELPDDQDGAFHEMPAGGELRSISRNKSPQEHTLQPIKWPKGKLSPESNKED